MGESDCGWRMAGCPGERPGTHYGGRTTGPRAAWGARPIAAAEDGCGV